MTPASLNIIWSTVASDRLEQHPDLPLPILLAPLRTARRMRLRVDTKRQLLKITYPRGLARKTVLGWAVEQKHWVAEQISAAPGAEPFVPGAMVPLMGDEVELSWSRSAPRTPELRGGQLIVGGPEAGFSRRVETFLKQLALRTLTDETVEVARLAGLDVASVSVGDATTRWGSCSSTRRIRYSWRLILAPPEARRFVVAHEVAHLKELNHGARFKALERQLFGGDVTAARASLRLDGPRLKRIGLRG